jgi:hypothetical protein
MFDHHSRDGGDKSPGPQLALSPSHGLGGWTAADTPDAAAVRFRTASSASLQPDDYVAVRCDRSGPSLRGDVGYGPARGGGHKAWRGRTERMPS